MTASDRSRRAVALTLAAAVAAVSAALVARAIGRGLLPGVIGAASDLIWVLLPLIAAGAALLILIQHTRNRIGWILMLWALGVAATMLNLESIAPDPPARLDLTTWLGLWFHNWSWILLIFPLLYLLQVFPTGRLLGRRWRWLVGIQVGMAAFLMITAALPVRLGPLRDWGAGVPDWTVENPIGVLPTAMWDGPLGGVWSLAMGLLVLGAALSVPIRYRRATPDERHQIKWLLYAVAILLVVVFGDSVIEAVSPAAFDLALGLAMAATPAAITIAVLRFHLYGIDSVISRTLVWGALAILMGVFYSFVVVSLGVVGIAIVAVAFQPVRRWLQQLANRVVYGRRATPYEVLSELTQTLANVESTQGVLDRTARRLGEATAASSAAVWMRAGDGLRPVGVWPAGADLPASTPFEDLPGYVAVIGSESEPLGALTVVKGIGDSVNPNERRLVDDLAGSSASVLRHATLQNQLTARAADLAASRRRLMEVQDAERHRMERELDEGAQQLVVALKVKLNVAARLARADGADGLADLLEGMDRDARDAISQIRSLARGLYPPLLEAEGLETAVRALAEVSAVPVDVTSRLPSDLRLPLETEAAIFFCVSEALTNAAKHAGGYPIRVDLRQDATSITFEVADSGPGFESESVVVGSGLRNMADRLDAIGGSLSIESSPGKGTRVRGQVPLPSQLPDASGALHPVGG